MCDPSFRSTCYPVSLAELTTDSIRYRHSGLDTYYHFGSLERLEPYVSLRLAENNIIDADDLVESLCCALSSATRKINICGDTH